MVASMNTSMRPWRQLPPMNLARSLASISQPQQPITDELARMIEQAPVPSFLLDTSGFMLALNKLAAQMLRRPQSSCIGLALDALLHPDDLSEAYWLTDGLMDGRRTSCRSEQRLISSDGSYFWASIAISLVRDTSGHAQCFWLQATDIDHRKREEQAIENSERRWSHALESAGQGVWEADLKTDTVHYSPTWRKLRGFAPDEVIDSSREAWLERVHPLDRDMVRARLDSPPAMRRRIFEYRERHKDGHYLWIQSRGSPVEYDDAGNPTHIVGTDTDITELKKVESQREALSHRLEMALSISGIGVFEVNLETGAVSYDSRLREIFGVPPDKTTLTQKEFEAVLHPDDAAGILIANRHAAKTHSSFTSTFRIIRPDGAIRTLKSHSAYSEDEDGTPMLIGTNWDITEDIKTQENLVAANSLAEARYSELEAAKQRIERLAMLDPLTELSNRRHLEEKLKEGTGSISALHVDLDRFKEINDSHGHLAGDAVLRHVGQVLRSVVPSDQFIARIGGDEFMIINPHSTNTKTLQELADKIRETLKQPFFHNGVRIDIGASIGISYADASDVDRLLSDADTALYRAKQTGRGRFVIFTEDLRTEQEQAKRVAGEILESISLKQFVPYYQPLVDAKTLKVSGVEALARWNHPKHGMISPVAFIKAAEGLNAIGDIDAIILEKTVADLNTWHAHGIDIPRASVNISFRRLQDDDLISSLKTLPITPGTLHFELLESIFLDESDDAFSANLNGIREMGIGIDIDDFGTGHTSFLSLFRLHPSRFKIDRQLVAPIIDSADKRKIVKSIIGIGKTLGIKVVAEGVETMEHAHILRRLGCDYLQGYAFARPMPADEIENWCQDFKAIVSQ